MASRTADWLHREGAIRAETRASDKTQHRRRETCVSINGRRKNDRCGYVRAQRPVALLLAAVLPHPARRAALPAGPRRELRERVLAHQHLPGPVLARRVLPAPGHVVDLVTVAAFAVRPLRATI